MIGGVTIGVGDTVQVRARDRVRVRVKGFWDGVKVLFRKRL